MFKIFFTDIDGTLLNKERQITPAVNKEIQRLKTELKIPVVLISSRMPKAMKHLHDELQLDDPIIPYNGALILNAAEIKSESDIMLSTTIEPKVVKKIIDFKSECDYHMSLYYNDDWYVEGMDYWANREVKSTKVTPSVAQHEKVLIDWEKMNTGAHKVMCMGDEDRIEKLSVWLNKEYSGVLNMYRSKPTFLEITPKAVSKATAVDFLLGRLGIESSEAVAIGDNYNDIEMLTQAGLGIAMGNAPEQVKDAADYTTLSNRENGLAEALKRFF